MREDGSKKKNSTAKQAEGRKRKGDSKSKNDEIYDTRRSPLDVNVPGNGKSRTSLRIIQCPKAPRERSRTNTQHKQG